MLPVSFNAGVAPGCCRETLVGPTCLAGYCKFVGLRGTFADKPLHTSALPAFRRGALSGFRPLPREARFAGCIATAHRRETQRGRSSPPGRPRSANIGADYRGTIVVRNLISNSILDNLWGTYESAIAQREKSNSPPGTGQPGRPISRTLPQPSPKVGAAFCPDS